MTRNATLRSECALWRAIRIIGPWTTALVALLASVGAFAASIEENTDRRIIVAITEKPDAGAAIGSSPRGYAGLPDYSGSQRTRAAARRIAEANGLVEIAAWTVEPLQIRCMLYEVPASSSREEMLDRLRADRRVRLAEPLREYMTLNTVSVDSPPVDASAAGTSRFNDPYAALQSGFSVIDAARAQQWATGKHVSVAVIDTAVDATHPDLQGQVAEHRDFVGDAVPVQASERHGTEVAGVIAALANNRIGIVGVAPAASIHAFRACWSSPQESASARCNSFTLAQALAAAIQSRAEVINLSLGGPRDPLLDELLGHALAAGQIVVAALPADPALNGFPSTLDGVIGVRTINQSNTGGASVVSAPGTDILTLEPGGSFDYASGSSLAAAHVSGTLALLLQASPGVDAERALGLLRESSTNPADAINACMALRLQLKQTGAACTDSPQPEAGHERG